MKKRGKVVLGLVLASLIFGPGFAMDDEALVRILEKADAAHNLASYCAQYDPSIIDRTRSTVGDMQQLMLHIRAEVVAGLPEPEALQIVVRSADAARAEALLSIRKLYGQNRNEEHARLSEWCKNTVVPLLRGFVMQHDNDHATLDEAIRKAKQDTGGPQERSTQ